MKGQSESIHYENVREINFLEDLKKKNSGKNVETLNFNSDRETMSSIAQKLYKKIVRKGYIENAKGIAIPQTRKKIQTMYDTSDKWIDDSEVFTEAENQGHVPTFSKFRAVSNIDIEQFYRVNNLSKAKQTKVQKQKQSSLSELMKDPLTVMKFQTLKKKIQQTISSNYKSTISN